MKRNNIMIKGFYSGNYEMSMLFSNWNNFDKILDLIDDYIELKKQIEEENNINKIRKKAK